MAVIFRPMSTGAVKHRGFAAKFGRSVELSGGIAHRVFDGYLFRAVATGANVIVCVLDLPSVWAFANNFFGYYNYGVYFYGDRAVVDPSTATGLPPDAPIELLTPAGVISPDSKLRTPLIPGLYQRLTVGGVFNSLLAFGRFSYVGSQVAGGQVVMTVPNSGAADVPMDTPIRTFCLVNGSGQRSLPEGEPLPDEVILSNRYHRSFVFDEGGIAGLIGVPTFRVWPRKIRTENQFFTHFLVTTHTANADLVGLGVDPYIDCVVLLPYVVQADEGPGISGLPVQPSEFDTRSGYLVAKVRTPILEPGAGGVIDPNPELIFVWAQAFLQANNLVLELRPFGGNQAFRHAALYGSLAVGTSSAVVVTTLLAQSDVDEVDGVIEKYGVQVRTFDLSNGASTLVTTYLERYNQTALVVNVHESYNEVVIDGVPWVAVVKVPATRDNSLPSTNATRDLTLVNGMADLLLIGAGGTTLLLALRATLWRPYSSMTRGVYSAMPQNTFGSYSYARLRIADFIGNGRVACIACPVGQANSSANLDWYLVICNATTGEVIESRGPIVTTPAKLDERRVFLSMAVVSREVGDGSGGVVTPAVLTMFVGYDVIGTDFASRTNYISNDGGATWRALFTGMHGEVYYMGTALRQVTIGQSPG